jgi:hypothetical protein
MNIHETKKITALGFFAASVFGLAATLSAAPPPEPPSARVALLPRADGSWLLRTGPTSGELRFAGVTNRGERLDELVFANAAGEPIAAAVDAPRALWFRETDSASGRDWLRLRDESGTTLREWEIPVFPIVNGEPTGRVALDVSPAGTWGVLRTIPSSGLAQLEWWNLATGQRLPVLAKESSFDFGLRTETLSRAELHPGWDWAFTMSAPKPRFADVLSEVATPCTSSTSFALPDGDRVLEALPTDAGLTFLAVERPVTGTDDGAIESLAVPGRRIVARRFLVVALDEAGHVLREEPLGSTTDGLDLSGSAIAFSREADTLLATDGSGTVELFDLVVGKRDRFSISDRVDELRRVDEPER